MIPGASPTSIRRRVISTKESANGVIAMDSRAVGTSNQVVRFRMVSCGGLGIVPLGCSGGDGRLAVFPGKGKVTVPGQVPEGALLVLYPARGGPEELRP